MNRALFITIGIVIILFVFGVWLFLFFNGAPTNTREVFSDLGIIETSERTIDPYAVEEADRVVLSLSDGVLQQVTTEPVAGYATASSTGEEVLRYLERGTGYFFDVNLRSGLKTQATPSTVPNATEAYFAPDLAHVVVVTEKNNVRSVVLVALPREGTEAAVTTNLDAQAENIEFLDTNTIAFTRNSFTETRGYTYEVESGATNERFRIAIPDATVITTKNNNLFAYPKPTRVLDGALYEVEGGSLSPFSEAEFGLVPFIGGGMGILNYIENNTYLTASLPSLTPQQVLMLPQKCAASSRAQLVWCGAPTGQAAASFVEDWYKGVVQSDDSLWSVDVLSGAAIELITPKVATGRQLDVTNLSLDPQEERLFFQNKIDATLWLYRLTQ